MAWDPDQYLRYADHRARPGRELIARIPDVEPSTVVDLGCGPGNLTAVLAERWPDAHVVGIDSSPEMIERAQADHPSIDWKVGDIGTWLPDRPVDVIYSNATLHWMDDHNLLFPRLRGHLSQKGALAVQMPDNWNAPTHQVPATILDEGFWKAEARDALMRDRLSKPADYLEWVQPAEVDIWRTTYFQQMHGDDPVWEWVNGSLLRPVLAEFDDIERERFSAVCRRRYRDAYRINASGITIVPFSRLFVIASAVGME
jgi:trans-aconitate 2-methyltransferase